MNPITSIQFNLNYSDGVVSFIKSQSGTDDIIANKIVSLTYSSIDQLSKDPCVMFGINSSSESDYFSTKHTLTEPKYILFDFGIYSIALEGISIQTASVDWYNTYYLKTSYDNFKIDSKRIITCSNPPNTVKTLFIFQLKKRNHLVF